MKRHETYLWYGIGHFDIRVVFLYHHIRESFTNGPVFDPPCTLRPSAVVNHIMPKLQSFSYIFVADTGTASVKLLWLVPKAIVLGEMTQNNGSYAIQGHSVSIESSYATFC